MKRSYSNLETLVSKLERLTTFPNHHFISLPIYLFSLRLWRPLLSARGFYTTGWGNRIDLAAPRLEVRLIRKRGRKWGMQGQDPLLMNLWMTFWFSISYLYVVFLIQMRRSLVRSKMERPSDERPSISSYLHGVIISLAVDENYRNRWETTEKSF